MGLLAAGLQAVRRDWPQSAQWPVAFAGLSGGAKRSGVLAAMLAKSGTVNICGMFLAGINEDRVSPAYHDYTPPRDFLNMPIWLSSGLSDPIAPPSAHDHVKLSLERNGFTRVRVENFDGRHELKPAEVQRALRWFRQLGRF
jgi:predicted esterase